MITRIILHVLCAVKRPKNLKWHKAGVQREFDQMVKLALLSYISIILWLVIAYKLTQ